MKKSTDRTVGSFLAALAVISMIFLLLNIVLLPLLREEIFLHRGTVTGPEFIVLIGFLIVALFTFLSMLWLAVQALRRQPRRGAPGRALFGALCLIATAAEKVMVDEIGREMNMNWETTGEWIILYGLLAVQLVYHIVFLRFLLRGSSRADDSDRGPSHFTGMHLPCS